MITEKRFASSHHAFWRELLPMGEHYIRTSNMALARFSSPYVGGSPAHFHGIVNELAFRLFARAAVKGVKARGLEESVISEELVQARRFIENFRQHGRGRMHEPGAAEVTESLELAERTESFFLRAATGPLDLTPDFAGCGWLSGCQGDVLASNVLYELKSGVRLFRMIDVKQVLIYCALNYSSKRHEIQDICLVNPREGIYFSESVNSLCHALAGRSGIDILGDIVEYVSASNPEYGTGQLN